MTTLDLIILAFFFAVAFTIWWYATIPKNLPPGPLGLPLIGSTMDTWNVTTWFKTLTDWTKKYGSVYKVYVGNQMVLVLGDYDAIQEAMVKQGDVYTGRPDFHVIFPDAIVGFGLANSEGELWKTQRRFALSTLRDFGFGRPIIEPRIKDEADYLLEAIGEHKGKPFEMTQLSMNAVSNVICSLVFGKRFDYGDQKFHWLLRLLRSRVGEQKISFMNPVVLSKTVSSLFRNFPAIKDLREDGDKLLDFIREQTADALKNFQPKTDEPSNYIQAFYKAKDERQDDPYFFDKQLAASVTNLFGAGTESTATTLRFAIFYLAHYPEVQEKVYSELRREIQGTSLLDYSERTKLPYVEAVIMEVQRMANLLPVSLFRRTMVDSKLRGYDIPARTVVAPLLGAVLRDPKVYPNPEQFDPERFLNPDKDGKVFSYLIPFSAGKRICLGESLAKMELFIFFTALFSKYRFYFPPGEPKPSLEIPGALIRSPPKYKICAEARGD